MKLFVALLLTSAVTLFACESTQLAHKSLQHKLKVEQEPSAMYKNFAPYFTLGVAINRKHAMQLAPPANKLIEKHFNSLTAENDMKWESIQATEGVFTFAGADALVSYAQDKGHTVIGHVLVWHSQTPDWVFEDEYGNPASRDLLLSRMKHHIFSLASRYRGKIKGWDVVNEALNEDGSMRQSKWYQIIGEDFIDKAFEYAHEADPGAELYYNDYNLFKSAKMDAAIRIAERLKSKGIRIDGIGAQAHYGLNAPIEELETSILKVANAGLKVMITELDISVLRFPESDNMGADVSLNFAFQDEYNPYAKGISSKTHAKLAQTYHELFSLFIKHHEKIERVTLWGVSDADSWRNNWPMRGRTDYPLLFDRHYKAKDFVNKLNDLTTNSKH